MFNTSAHIYSIKKKLRILLILLIIIKYLHIYVKTKKNINSLMIIFNLLMLKYITQFQSIYHKSKLLRLSSAWLQFNSKLSIINLVFINL